MFISRLSLTVLILAATFLAAACGPSKTTSAEPEAAEAPSPTEALAEATPTTEAASEPMTDTTADATPTNRTRTGRFASAEHETTGNAELVTQNGQTTLVFDDTFATSNGPDLYVVLHRSANLIAESTPPAFPIEEDDYIVIAPLASIDGRQEYVVPAEVNLDDYEAVAVWCQQFNATFGAAPLQ
jgi:hypothetical protein